MPKRYGSVGSYRYGFQGQEKDDEIKGEGNSLNYKYRMHDPRVGRFFAPDPLEGKFPWWTPYQFSGNRLLDAVELEGKEIYFYVWDQGKTTGYTQVHHVQTVEEIKQESEIVFLTDLFGWTITQTANLRNLGIEQTYVLYDDSWKLVPADKLNQSLTQITKDEWDSFLTLDDINNSIEALRSIGAKAELAISIVELGDGLKNLYDAYRSFKRKSSIKSSFGSGSAASKIDNVLEGNASLKNSFTDGKYDIAEAAEDITVYRVSGGTSGSDTGEFFSIVKPNSSAQAEELLNINKWGNTGTDVTPVTIKKGTQFATGGVEGGKGQQIFIPKTLQTSGGNQVIRHLDKTEKLN